MSACTCPTCGQAVDPLDLLIDRAQGLITFEGETARLTPVEMDFAITLIDAHPAVLSKDGIHRRMYGHLLDGGPEVKIIDVLACKVRKKLDQLGLVITTSWGIGYGIIVAEAENADAIRRTAFVDTRKTRRTLDRSDIGRIRMLRERGHLVSEIASQMRLTYRAVSVAVQKIEEEDRKAEQADILKAARLPAPAKGAPFVEAAE